MDGWQCVVKKGEFTVGDLGVYFEIDSFLPAEDERYAFLEPKFITWEGKRGARIKTMKLKGQLSQGLLLPLTLYPEVNELEDGVLGPITLSDLSDDTVSEIDLTEKLGIEKWEKPIPVSLRGVSRGNFPSFIPKTDQERIQNIERLVFDKYAEEVFQESTKMDGSSLTAYYIPPSSKYFATAAKPDAEGNLPEFVAGVCSRNLDLVETEGNQFWKTAREEQVLEKLATLERAVAIQGELCGSGIQSNFEGFPEGYYGFYVYDIFDIENQEYLRPSEVEHIVRELGLKHVPVTSYFKLSSIAKNAKDLLARAEGQGINGRPREGVVYKHADSGFSFKAISDSYLLKHGE